MAAIENSPKSPRKYEQKVDYSMFGTHKCVMKFCEFNENVMIFKKVRTNVLNDCYFNLEIPYNKVDKFVLAFDPENREEAAILLKLSKATESKIIKELRLGENIFTTEVEEDKPEKQYLAIKFKYVKDKKNKNKPTVEKIMLGIETYYKDSNKDGIEEIEWSEMAPYLE